MKKKILGLLLVMSMTMCGLVACGTDQNVDEASKPAVEDTEAAELKTYEFETFDGSTVVIDKNNIVSQEAYEEPLEWDGLPADAEQIAPGRDFILFATDTMYYVEDAADNLITTATRSADEVAATDTSEIFSNGTFTFEYYPSAFYVREEEDSVIASFVDESVDVAGANIVELKVIENTDLDTAVKEYQDTNDIEDEDISDVIPFVTNNANSRTITYGDTSTEGSELKTQTTAYFVENGDDVVYIEVFRHIGPDENTEIYINDMIAVIFDTLTF